MSPGLLWNLVRAYIDGPAWDAKLRQVPESIKILHSASLKARFPWIENELVKQKGATDEGAASRRYALYNVTGNSRQRIHATDDHYGRPWLTYFRLQLGQRKPRVNRCRV